jgi:hypothetical protein
MTNPKQWYFINLESRNPRVEEYPQEDLLADLETHEVSKPDDLSDYDFKVFGDYETANKWLERYLFVRDRLGKLKTKLTSDCQHLLYKRRYLIQTLMGEKLQTYRNYHKPLKKGDLLNLHDQTHFLTVKVKNVRQTDRDEWKYEFELLTKPV